MTWAKILPHWCKGMYIDRISLVSPLWHRAQVNCTGQNKTRYSTTTHILIMLMYIRWQLFHVTNVSFCLEPGFFSRTIINQIFQDVCRHLARQVKSKVYLLKGVFVYFPPFWKIERQTKETIVWCRKVLNWLSSLMKIALQKQTSKKPTENG